MILHDFGRRLEAIRTSRSLTQDVIAKQLGVSKRSYCAYEAGETAPNAKFLAALAAMGVDIAYVLTGMRATTYAALAAVNAGTKAGVAVEAMTGSRADAHAVQEAIVNQSVLKPDEVELLDNYRQCSEEGKATVRSTCTAFANQVVK